MNLFEMRTQLRSRIGNPTITDVPDSVLTQELNAAYLDIEDRYRFHKARKRCQFLTVPGQSRYDLPSDVLSVFRVSDETNHRKMIKIGERDAPQTLAKPMRYVRYRDWLELDPTPDGVYTMEVYYKYFHGRMSEDQHVPGLPLAWHEGIVVLAKYNYYINIATDQVKAGAAYQAWELWIRTKPTEIDEESVDIDSGVEVVPLNMSTTDRLDFDHSD
jgi:hypothetical protein